MSHAIYHNLEIEAPIHKVYAAITRPEQLVHWWPQKCTGIPKENEVYNFFFTSAYDWFGKVVKVEQNRSFYIKMTHSDADWDPTTFGFDLVQKKDTILVEFSHTGWPSCNQHFKRSSYCWALLLNGLKQYVEKGIVIPFNQRS